MYSFSWPVKATLERTGRGSWTSRTTAPHPAARTQRAIPTLARRIGPLLRLHALGVAGVELGEAGVVLADDAALGGVLERLLVGDESLVVAAKGLESHRKVVEDLPVLGVQVARPLEAEERLRPGAALRRPHPLAHLGVRGCLRVAAAGAGGG